MVVCASLRMRLGGRFARGRLIRKYWVARGDMLDARRELEAERMRILDATAAELFGNGKPQT